MTVEEPIYDLTFKEKCRIFSPLRHVLIFLAGLFCIPYFISGGVFTVMLAIDKFNGSEDEYVTILWPVAISLFIIPLLFFIFSIIYFNRKINNRYIFYDDGFKVITKKKEYSFDYSEIWSVNEVKSNYFCLHLYNKKDYLIGKSCLGEVTPEEFFKFIDDKKNVHKNEITASDNLIVKAKYKIEKEDIIENLKVINLRVNIVWLIVCILFVAGFIYIGVNFIISGNIIIGAIIIAVFVMSVIRRIITVIRSIKKIENDPPVEIEYDFYENYFVKIQGENRQEYDYSRLGKSFETKNHFYLLVGGRQYLIIGKKNFETGTYEDLGNLLNRKLAGKFKKYK